MIAPGCADLSETRDESLRATASRVHRWLLVEHPGSWGTTAPPTARLNLEVVRSLEALAKQYQARLLMIRRPVRRSEPGRWVFLATSTVGREQLLARHVDDDDELLRLDHWEEREEPLWLVCTHTRHDLCCALRGRPVAKAMLAADPENVWEASHVGGDRFAANVVLLPEGHYFGRVPADGAVDLMTSYRAGRLDLATWRGRSSLPSPTQAAQSFAREATGLDGVGDLALIDQVDDGPDRWRVRLEGGVEVVVGYVRDGQSALLTCQATAPGVTALFALISVREG